MCAGVVLVLSSLRDVTSTMLILAGVGLTYFLAALTATVQFVASEQQLAAIIGHLPVMGVCLDLRPGCNVR